jgi:hypothetical protein
MLQIIILRITKMLVLNIIIILLLLALSGLIIWYFVTHTKEKYQGSNYTLYYPEVENRPVWGGDDPLTLPWGPQNQSSPRYTRNQYARHKRRRNFRDSNKYN